MASSRPVRCHIDLCVKAFSIAGRRRPSPRADRQIIRWTSHVSLAGLPSRTVLTSNMPVFAPTCTHCKFPQAPQIYRCYVSSQYNSVENEARDLTR